MAMLPRLLFVFSLVVVPIVVWATSSGLPARVATHFGLGGLANGWMRHDQYIAFMLVMTVVVPLVVVLATGLLPRFATSRISLRNRQYWLAPERRKATLAWLASYACVMGILLGLLMLGVHFLVLEANARNPARLDEPTFFVVLGGFVVLVLIWVIALALRFRTPR